MAARILEGNQGVELLSHSAGCFSKVGNLAQLVDHVTLVDYEGSLFVVLGLEQHDIGFKTTSGCLQVF